MQDSIDVKPGRQRARASGCDCRAASSPEAAREANAASWLLLVASSTASHSQSDSSYANLHHERHQAVGPCNAFLLQVTQHWLPCNTLLAGCVVMPSCPAPCYGQSQADNQLKSGCVFALG